MKLIRLSASRYRCLREVSFSLGELNVFIGPNASGKSSILDALRFLQEGVQQRDFQHAVRSRLGILALAWMGDEHHRVSLAVELSEREHRYEWSVILDRGGNDFTTSEAVFELHGGSARKQLLESNRGEGWWLSGENRRVPLAQSSTACALSAAAADASFPARKIADFVDGWGFFDPNPFLLHGGWAAPRSSRLDSYGRNLAERLDELSKSSPEVFEQIVSSTQSILGFPMRIKPVEVAGGQFFLLHQEWGIPIGVLQSAVSSGTLRILALMSALFGEEPSSLVGIEEPENNIHPTALAAFAQHLLKARQRVQILITTHSPLLLDYLNDPSAVCVVHRSEQEGTKVIREEDPERIRTALMESGFGLGELYETTGFGG
ncbi:MAG TPA: AAA family ATPase [Pirellulales bacterium]|nr:AAA family ATPase [Pirellulales bacterium]